ncbi:MAG: TRAP transporter small permease subunit [Xanthomonadaceae bacterium]|nr:TRAP transporter small permease subunit [Xanthomonadaceae bacterium]
MRAMLSVLKRAMDGLARGVAISVGIAVLSMVAIIAYGVVAREVFHLSDVWVTAVTTYTMAYVTFLGSCVLAWQKRHLRVDVLSHFAGARSRRALDVVTTLVSAAAAIAIAWLCTSFWLDAWSSGERDWGMFSIRMWIPYLSLWIGTLLLAFVQVLRVVFALLDAPGSDPLAGRTDA